MLVTFSILKRSLKIAFVALLVLSLGLGAAIFWGEPDQPLEMASINNPFKGLDYSRLPPLQTYATKDAQRLSYREYSSAAITSAAAATRAVVLVHGSSADSRSMHTMAQAIQAAGFSVFSIDIRGHGASSSTSGKGHIAYIGQLEDDMLDFARHLKSKHQMNRVSLVGFSSGGGFALRLAGTPALAQAFNHYVLLAPFISQSAPTYRPNSGGWVSVGLPRIVALSLLNGIGITRLNHLIVTRFALNEGGKKLLTDSYDFNLAMNFRPLADYHANIVAAKHQRISVLVGEADESFHANQFAAVFSQAGHGAKVNVLPGIQHIPMILDRRSLDAIVGALQS